MSTAGLDDAFREALLEHLLGDTVVRAVIERDDGLVDSAGIPSYFAPPKRWSDLDRWGCDALSGRLLDIGAGAGRHSLFLQERGCAVTALDISPLALECLNEPWFTTIWDAREKVEAWRVEDNRKRRTVRSGI